MLSKSSGKGNDNLADIPVLVVASRRRRPNARFRDRARAYQKRTGPVSTWTKSDSG
jgi:hypothetical protein